MVELPSKLLAEAVESLATLPSIGKKSALRLALHMIQSDPMVALTLSARIAEMVTGIKRCDVCNNLSDEEKCAICLNEKRQKHVLCIVESFRDVIAIEETGQFKGTYHVLGGVISPIDGVRPADLNLDKLWSRLDEQIISEVILAINPTMDGEITNFFIYQKLKDKNIKVSAIARGVAFGGELEYADGLTLGHSISSRRPYQTQD